MEYGSTQCAAKGCTKEVPAEVLMCRMHWVMVPSDIQARLYDAFRNEEEYLLVVKEAIEHVRLRERKRKQHAAEERHEFREALKLLRRAVDHLPDSELGKDVVAFVKRHQGE